MELVHDSEVFLSTEADPTHLDCVLCWDMIFVAIKCFSHSPFRPQALQVISHSFLHDVTVNWSLRERVFMKSKAEVTAGVMLMTM